MFTLDEKNIKEFGKQFEEKIFPTIKGEDGKGIQRLKKLVENKREEVQKRKQNRPS